jgi:hypothetical protein
MKNHIQYITITGLNNFKTKVGTLRHLLFENNYKLKELALVNVKLSRKLSNLVRKTSCS